MMFAFCATPTAGARSGDGLERLVEPLVAAPESVGHAGGAPAVAHLLVGVAHREPHRGAATGAVVEHERVDAGAGEVVELLRADDPVRPLDLVVGAPDAHRARAVGLGEHP